MGPDAMILVFWSWALRQLFHSLLSLSSRAFQFLFTFCHEGGVICISEVIDISPSNLDSSLCFFQPSVSHDVLCIEVKWVGWEYTALTYSFSYLEPVCCSMSGSICCFLTCIQISQEADQVVWYSHLLKNFPQFIVIHTVKGFGMVNKAEIDGMLLSHKKEHIWISSNRVNERRAYYTEWSKSEKEKQISYINTYMWNLERWYWWTYVRGSSGDADRDQTCGHSGEGEQHGSTHTATCKTASGNLLCDSGTSNRGSVTT